jgi:hypothetical protein
LRSAVERGPFGALRKKRTTTRDAAHEIIEERLVALDARNEASSSESFKRLRAALDPAAVLRSPSLAGCWLGSRTGRSRV